jgi:hypothetical protein
MGKIMSLILAQEYVQLRILGIEMSILGVRYHNISYALNIWTAVLT